MNHDMSINLNSAINAWSNSLGNNKVLDSARATERYGASEIGVSRRISGAVLPTSREEVVEVVKIAATHKVPLYPISTGNNWGYGSANPARDDCVIVDLSSMNRIVAFDSESGLLTVQPGVTQRQLQEFLQSQDQRYLIPVTGAGPDCSLLGNALERGYGITPYQDHFGAVTSLEAVMPNGEIFKPMLHQLGGQEVDKAFKWGIGPYVDGLFTQGNFGVVTEMTIALAPWPEEINLFTFAVKDKENLPDVVSKVRIAVRRVGHVIGGVNLMNTHRVLSMTERYPPPEQRNANGLIPEALLKDMAKKNQIMAWTGLGALYGTKKMVAAGRSELKSILGSSVHRLFFLSPRSQSVINWFITRIPVLKSSKISEIVKNVDKTMTLLAGRPSDLALALCYWRHGHRPPENIPMNPARDGCGIIWYAPLVPMKAEAVTQYVSMVETICIKHGMEPLITLTSVSDRCFDSTVPLLFDRTSETETLMAHTCYQELFETGRQYGFVPYRLGIQSMEVIKKYNSIPPILKLIKNAVDPDHIISPGRYIL